jgi:hypothetical protein
MPRQYTIPTDGRRSDALKKRALQSVPPDARDPKRAQEELLAVVWVMVLVDCQLATWLRMALIGTAVGAWLDAHGSDYDKPRRKDEQDDQYRTRIPKVEKTATPAAVLEAATDALASASIAGAVTLKELWRHAVHCDVGYCDNTSETCGPGPAILVVLPAATPAAVARSVYEAVRAKKLGGVFHVVLPSTNGGRP